MILLPLSFTNSFESQHQLFSWSQWSTEILLLIALSLPVPVIRKISGLAEDTFGLYSVLLRCHEGDLATASKKLFHKTVMTFTTE